MADLTRRDLESRLWATLEDEKMGMLGLVGEHSGQMQPMTAFCDRDLGAIWFFTRRDNELVRRLVQGGKAMFNLVSKDRSFWACLSGTITEQHDGVRIDKYWNPVVAAWFPEGKDDPELTLLRFDAEDAEVWHANKGPIRLALEIARANLADSEPDLGEHARLNLH
ncbi:MAG TPA: pyridoxamine 5'-phosphate oxidase family protein [Caulobacteraceae bacterium]